MPGVHWIGIEDADLRVLCGCPADVVKHLMRRGFIVGHDENGTFCETGPNAILFSDVMLQGGTFANLAEFPVLQMLYRQGMILPGHPNNTGAKPLLIGLAGPIQSQLDYIFRGNYGLISEEELTEAGCSADEAREQMRIKLRFAFGRIQPATELLDTHVVGADRSEIRNGVFIRRLGLNRYRFEYGDEAAEVDLNLKQSETYLSPYPLGMHRPERDYFSIIHSGEGDGWDIDRPCMSSVVSYQGRLFLIDAGPNLEASLSALSISVNEIEGIFQTHSHDDHFCGLTSLMRADHKLRFYATPLVRASVTKKFSALLGIEEKRFNGFFDVIDLQVGTWNDIDGLEIMPVMSPHPVETTVLRFRTLGGDGYRSYTHLADITANSVLRSMITDDPEQPGLSADHAGLVMADYREAADLKKIDIGGGLIHGAAEDFIDDASGKIVLAHVARPLTTAEKQIGSGADFGITDVLIPRTQDYVRLAAYDFLRSYFPDQSASRLQILLNNPVRTFNPHEILMKENEPLETLLLVLSGNAEGIRAGNAQPNRITAGALLGELSALTDGRTVETYRATSYLKALILPAELYKVFIDKYAKREALEALGEKRRWLRQTWVFGEGLSYPVQNRIAQAMTRLEVEDGELDGQFATKDIFSVRVVEDGILKRFVGNGVVETLRAGEFFNEDKAVFRSPMKGHLRSVGPSSLWNIPSTTLIDIPNVRWKLFEAFRRRLVLTQAPTE